MRIGLDIDDCLADFWGAYCEYFDTDNNPKMLEDHIITRNVQRILKNDRDFWLNLKVKTDLTLFQNCIALSVLIIRNGLENG